MASCSSWGQLDGRLRCRRGRRQVLGWKAPVPAPPQLPLGANAAREASCCALLVRPELVLARELPRSYASMAPLPGALLGVA